MRIYNCYVPSSLGIHFFYIESAIHPLSRYVGGHYIEAEDCYRLFCQKTNLCTITQIFIHMKKTKYVINLI